MRPLWCAGSLFFAFLFPLFVFADDISNLSPRIKIGVLIPLTGSYAPIGVDNQQGIEVAKAELGSRSRIDFIIADNKADPIQSISEYKRLLLDPAIVGFFVFRGPPGMALNPLSRKDKISLLGGVGNQNFAEDNEYAFQLWPRADIEGAFLATKVHDRGFSKVALLTLQDDWTLAVLHGFREKFRSVSGTIVYDQEVLPNENEFRAHVAKLKSLDFDAVILNVGLNQTPTLAKQLREASIEKPIFSNFWAGKKEAITASAGALEGVMFVEMATDLKNLRANLISKFKSTPSGATLSAYVAALMLEHAAADLKIIDAAHFYDRLREVSEVETADGVFSVKDRLVQFPLTLRKIRKGVVGSVEGEN